jgi:hypothetical protein
MRRKSGDFAPRFGNICSLHCSIGFLQGFSAPWQATMMWERAVRRRQAK